MLRRTYKLTGVTPLMMHNGQLADPLNPYAIELKKVSSVRIKTESHHEKMARIEFEGGLYIDPETGFVAIPAHALRATIVEGAKKQKRGKQAKAAVFPEKPYWTLEYRGPRDIQGLYDNKAFVDRALVSIGTNRVARTRPIFRQWAATVTVLTDESLLSGDSLDEAIITAGECVGLLESRPACGRYTVEVL